MIIKKLAFVILTLMVSLSALLIISCGSDGAEQSGQTDLLAEDDHSSHNHADGEHHDALTPGVSENETLDWCAEHAVPESQCTKCNPTLIASFKESGDWCGGHDLPESHCRLCNPGIVFPQEEELRTRAQNRASEEITIELNFRHNAAICATDGALIQFASATTAERTGLTIQAIRESDFATTIKAPAEIVFDETKATVVTTSVTALVSRWLVSAGDVVLEGDVLAIVQSPEIAELKSALVSAQATYEVEQKELERHRQLHERTLISESELDRQRTLVEQSHAALTAAKGLLLAAGLSASDIDEVFKHETLSNSFALRASADGTVIERIARLGELMEAGRAFAIVADPTAMWIEASLTEEQIRHVSLNQDLTFVSDGRGLNRVGGKVIWISRFLDQHTRTATVRAKVLDPKHRLQAGEFGRVNIIEEDDTNVMLVPKDAVQWEGCCNVVFVKESVDRFRPRKVEVLDGEGPYYQIKNGVRVGEEVVVDGAFLLKTELKKSSIGAGCCGLEPVG